MSEEARTGKRFDLELPIKIHGKGGDDSATTGNMSAAGVYFMADVDLAIGSNIEFDITLPAKVLGTPGDVEVHCTGCARMRPQLPRLARTQIQPRKRNPRAALLA